MKFDRQDALCVVGVLSLLGGIGMWSVAAALIVAGLLSLASVWMIELSKRKSEGKGN
jgi:hypothetical protein